MNISFGGSAGFPPGTVVPFNAGDFSGSGGLTWTVAAGDVNGFTYSISGKLLYVEFDLTTTTVGGVLANTFLQVAIPGGFTPRRTVQVPCLGQDNSAIWEPVLCIITQNSPLLLFRRLAGDWSASVDNTRLDLGVTFFVN